HKGHQQDQAVVANQAGQRAAKTAAREPSRSSMLPVFQEAPDRSQRTGQGRNRSIDKGYIEKQRKAGRGQQKIKDPGSPVLGQKPCDAIAAVQADQHAQTVGQLKGYLISISKDGKDQRNQSRK